MAEQTTLYRAADGQLFESETEADRHDMRSALVAQAERFMDKALPEKQRTIQRAKATELMVAFSLQMIIDGPLDEDNNDGDTDRTPDSEEGTDET